MFVLRRRAPARKRPRRVLSPVLLSGPSSIEGAGDITLGADTLAATGAVDIAGTGGPTLGPDTTVSAGEVAIAAAAAILEVASTLSSTAAVAIAAAGAPTLDPDTLAATGTAGSGGDAAIQEAASTLLAAGEAAVNASAAIIEAASTLVATGQVDAAGQATILEAATTLLSSGQAAIAGAGALLQAPTTAAGTGTVASGIMGAGTITLSPDTLASIAAAAIAGAASITELAAITAAAGTVFGPVQSVILNVGPNVNNTPIAFPQPLTAGNMIHVAVVTFQSVAGTTITTPTDTIGHTYQAVHVQQNNSGNTVHLREWYVPGCNAGANTITADISGSGLGEITVCASEWPGRDAVSPLSGTPSLAGPTSTSTPSTGNMTPSHDSCLVIGVLNAGGVAVTITEEAGWNLLREYEGNDGTVTLSVVWKLQPVAAPIGASWALSASPICLSNVAAFRPTGTVGITGVAAIVLGPDTLVASSSGTLPGSGGGMMLLGVGR